MRASSFRAATGLVALLAATALLLNSLVPPPGALALTSLEVRVEGSLTSHGANVTLGNSERMATMFLLLFITSLVGLYMASRYLKRKGSGFSKEALGRKAPKTERVPEPEPGEAYLVTQGQDRAMKIFTQALRQGHPGLCITRTYPDKLKESWDLDGAKVLWLTDDQAKAKTKGAVQSLEGLEERVRRFLGSAEKGVLLLDGLEYLFVQYSFTEVMKVLQGLRDAVPASGARLIIPIDLLALVRRQRALLTREFRQF